MEPAVQSTPDPAGAGMPEPVGSPTRRAWMLAGAAAAVVFMALEFATPFLAVQLRELSSILAHVALQAIGFPVSRAGTILSTPRATFDVVPACSGSTTLQALLFFSILWCGVHPRLTPLRKAAGMLLAIPLAILANAVRVAALVALGHAAGGEPDEVLHVVTGLVAFALALAGCYLMTRLLAARGRPRVSRDRALPWILCSLLVYLSLPFLAWCLENWGGGSLDRYGQFFVGAAAAVAVWKWRRAPEDASCETAGTLGLGLAFLGMLASMLVDVNLLRGLSLLLTFLSLALAWKGVRFAASMIPVSLLAYLGFPSVSYQLGTLTSWRFTDLSSFLILKSLVGLGLLAAHSSPGFRDRTSPRPVAGRRRPAAPVLMAAVLAAIQTYSLGFSGEGREDLQLELSYLQGSWFGSKIDPPASESEYFGSDRIWSRMFVREGARVDVLVTSTGGDRHRAHPPAYCVSGNGWETVGTDVSERRLGDGGRIPVTRLRLRKEGDEMLFCYWFTNGTDSFASFSGMLFHDTLGRLGGRRPEWFVFRVMTVSGESALDAFFSEFRPALKPRARRSGPPRSPEGADPAGRREDSIIESNFSLTPCSKLNSIVPSRHPV
jgi:EpsI family protein